MNERDQETQKILDAANAKTAAMRQARLDARSPLPPGSTGSRGFACEFTDDAPAELVAASPGGGEGSSATWNTMGHAAPVGMLPGPAELNQIGPEGFAHGPHTQDMTPGPRGFDVVTGRGSGAK